MTRRFTLLSTLTIAALVTASTASANIVVNGDFESGGIADPGSNTITPAGQADSGWQADNQWAVDATGEINGTAEARAAFNVGSDNFAQIITSSAGGSFTFSFDWKLDYVSGTPGAQEATETMGFSYGIFTTSDNTAELNLGGGTLADGDWSAAFADSFTESFGDTDNDGNADNGTASGTVSETITLPGGQNWVGIVIRGTTSGNFQDFSSSQAEHRVDNVSLVIPEPATIALLGLGGAVMLSGRRRRV